MGIENAKKAITDNAKQIGADIGHAINGNFDQISVGSQTQLANMIRNHMHGISRYELPVNDRVTLGYVERSIGGGGSLKEVYVRIALP